MTRITPMRPARLLVLAGLLVVPSAGEAAEPTVHTVRIHQFTFEPAELEVRAGDAVIWVNEDLAPHTATGSDRQWGTGPLGLGASQRVAFPDAGTFAYRCLYHPQMRGTIAVSGPHAERRPSRHSRLQPHPSPRRSRLGRGGPGTPPGTPAAALFTPLGPGLTGPRPVNRPSAAATQETTP